MKNHGIRIEYRLSDGRECLGEQVRGSIWLFDLLYADDMVIFCESADMMRESVARLEQATQEAGLDDQREEDKVPHHQNRQSNRAGY